MVLTNNQLDSFTGDDHYPKELDIIGKKPIPDYPQSLEEVRSKAKCLNRIELRGPTCTVFCNLKLTCGHLSPVTHHASSVEQVEQSLL